MNPHFMPIKQAQFVIVAFIKDNATMSSIRFFENDLSYFVTKTGGSRLYISVSISLKYVIKVVVTPPNGNHLFPL